MVSTLYAGSSAMQAYNKVMDITANNIANVNTAGYSTQGAVLSEASPESLSIRPVTGVKVATVAQPVDMDIYNTTVKHSNNVDIGAEVVDEITSLRAYQANAKTVHAAANTIGTVLDMKA